MQQSSFLTTSPLTKNPARHSLFYGPYLASYPIVAQLFAYCAFMSFGFYQGLLDRILGTQQPYLAVLTTVSVALMIYLGLDALAGYQLRKRQKASTQSKDKILFRSLWIVVGLLLILDVYANWQGRGVVAESSTTEVRSKEDSMYQAIQVQIDSTQAELNSLLEGAMGGYGWFEKQTYKLNWSGKEFQRSLREEIQLLRQQQLLFSRAEIDKGKAQKRSYEEKVDQKKQAHGFLVFLAYPLSFLLCVFQRYYRMKRKQLALQNSLPTPTKVENKGYKIRCENCHKETYMRSPRARYCSSTCRSQAHKKRVKQEELILELV